MWHLEIHADYETFHLSRKYSTNFNFQQRGPVFMAFCKPSTCLLCHRGNTGILIISQFVTANASFYHSVWQHKRSEKRELLHSFTVLNNVEASREVCHGFSCGPPRLQPSFLLSCLSHQVNKACLRKKGDTEGEADCGAQLSLCHKKRASWDKQKQIFSMIFACLVVHWTFC